MLNVVIWVMGHAKEIDIERGRTTLEDKVGNDGADRLAVQGAATHQVPFEIVLAASQRKASASATQRMMLDILSQRQLWEQHFDEAADRGSDAGDPENLPCMEFGCVEHEGAGASACACVCEGELAYPTAGAVVHNCE